ncbi:MAG TPA: SRPBCC family protein [Bryobacteraceae bacterium]|jgi:ligand-binding SRPBCC domain-containing protein
MPTIGFETAISAPIERCFDLARSIDLHIDSMPGTSERAVGGITTGLIGLNQEVTWEATHFLVRQRLTSRIVAYDRPRHFRDSQVSGVFRRFDHDHFFEWRGGRTLMKDTFDYQSPLGWLGRLADILFLEGYMRRLLIRRAAVIRMAAEKD